MRRQQWGLVAHGGGSVLGQQWGLVAHGGGSVLASLCVCVCVRESGQERQGGMFA